MKLAFTTLGCPTWNLNTIISKAIEFGYDGVDFRGYLGEMEVYKLPEFTTSLIETKKMFADASLEIPCFSSSVRLFTSSEVELENHLEELQQYGKLCSEFNTPYIRVFGGSIGETSRPDAIDIVVTNLQKMLKVAQEYQVTLLLETHDDWTKCDYAKDVLKRIDSAYFDILWDVHHPYRTVGENPELTWETIGDRIKYTHWKDSYRKEDTSRGYQLCLLGEGDIPLEKMYRLLQDKGYDGYYTLEWEKVWCPEIEEPEIAFGHYTNFMNAMANKITN